MPPYPDPDDDPPWFTASTFITVLVPTLAIRRAQDGRSSPLEGLRLVFTSFAVAIVLIGVVVLVLAAGGYFRRAAWRIGMLDSPKLRGVHGDTVARSGGITIGAALLGALLVEKLYQPPHWLAFSIWLPLTLLMSLVLLQPVKGMMVAWQWAQRMHGFDPNHVDEIELMKDAR